MNIKFQNKRISYTVVGEGEAVMFLHGFTENKEMWEAFVEEFAKEFQVFTVDLPGHGDTECFSAVHTMEFMAETVKAVLDKQKVKKCTFIGHSMGGYTALAFADLYPEMLNGLVLFHSSATADTEEVRKHRDRLIKLVQGNKTSFINSFIPSLFTPRNRLLFKFKIDEIVSQSNQTSEQGIIAALEGMKLRTEKISLLKKADFPILFIVGKQDSRISIEKILPQIALPKKSYSLMIENVGHMGFVEAEKETIDMLLSFVSGL